jgi:hypothetical protein
MGVFFIRCPYIYILSKSRSKTTMVRMNGPKAPDKCPHCNNGPVLIKAWIHWGESGDYYFCKCSACGYEYAAIDDEEMQLIGDEKE